jgi:peptidoglycan/xylan/chitin deacetylase (PgdA/CDA1 family)
VGRYWRRKFVRSAACSTTVRFTFDDGPDPWGTSLVLDVLKRHAIKATFFVVGENVERHPALFLRIRMEGHDVGHHGYKHRFPWFAGPRSTYRDMLKEESVLRRDGDGIQTELYRPPYGKLNFVSMLVSVLRKRKIVYWTIDPRDYDQSDAQAIRKDVIERLEAGSVVLLHDGGYHRASNGSAVTAEALEMILTDMQEKGLLTEATKQWEMVKQRTT